MRFVRWFGEVGLSDVGLVGGKNSSLGEMIHALSPLGIRVPDGFAVTSEAYRHFLHIAGLEDAIRDLLFGLVRDDVQDLVAEVASPLGRLRHVIPAARMSETPTFWSRPPVPLGTHAPVWPT